MLRKLSFAISLLFIGLMVLQNCKSLQSVAENVNFQPDQVPYQQLSDYAFFADLPAQHTNAGVLPYDLITPLFTDYAHKARFVWMPDSVSASISADGVLQFPDNTVLIKTFYYPTDFQHANEDHQLVETRLLMKVNQKWQAFTYVWDKDGKDATLNIVGDFKAVHWKDLQGVEQEIEYVVPNKNQCKSCHNSKNSLQPIGPKVKNLNKDFLYANGEQKNQLKKWQEQGFLQHFETTTPPIADWENAEQYSLEERALAYLEINCGHCHQPDGSAHTTGLYLTTDQKEKGKLGFCKTPVAAGKGSGGLDYGIVPGQPDSSFLLFRMKSDDPGIMMPELGRVIPHKEGIQLVRDWIASLNGNCD